MKVLFVDDVPNVGKVGQTRDVADGYARNFLFPRKLAVLADSRAAAMVDAHLKKLVKQRAVEEAQMAELAGKINGLMVTMRAKVGENDKLYGSITGADIAEALSKAAGCLIDKKNVVLSEPIKMAGLCDVTIKFMHDITAVIKANVIDENATDETPVVRAEKKAEKAEKKEKPEAAAAEPKKEKAEKKEKKAKAPKEEKAEEPAAEAKAEKTAEEKPAKAEKPAKEKKAKAEKAPKEEAPAAEAKSAAAAEEKKEKKPRKSKKEETAE